MNIRTNKEVIEKSETIEPRWNEFGAYLNSTIFSPDGTYTVLNA